MSTTWTEDRVKLLAALASEGWSASQIADKLDTTRNAIIGKLDRLGLQLRNLVSGSTVLPRPSKPYVRRPKPLRAVIPEPEQAAATPPVSSPIPLWDLTSITCRWPVNDGWPQFMFCGEQVAPGHPYCTAHLCKAYARKP
jgi:GcrA cell cycle regulator